MPEATEFTCEKCGQFLYDPSISGEYPCSQCGQATVHDDVPRRSDGERQVPSALLELTDLTPEVVTARNQREHPGYRMQSWRRCPLCGIEFKVSNMYSFRDRWWMHLTADHKRSADDAKRILEDCRPEGKGEWDAT